MRRTAITGIGVVAPGGSTRDAFWDLLMSGRTATRRITFFDPSGFRSQIAAECDFDPEVAGLSQADTERMDRYVQFAVAAAHEALADSGLDLERVERERLGVVLGSAVGGTTRLEADYVAVSDHGREWLVDPSGSSRRSSLTYGSPRCADAGRFSTPPFSVRSLRFSRSRRRLSRC